MAPKTLMLYQTETHQQIVGLTYHCSILKTKTNTKKQQPDIHRSLQSPHPQKSQEPPLWPIFMKV